MCVSSIVGGPVEDRVHLFILAPLVLLPQYLAHKKDQYMLIQNE